VHRSNVHRGRPAAMLALFALFAFALGGCTGWGREPPPVDPNLFPAKHREQVADFLRTYLNNPTKVRDAYISEPALKPVGQTVHYVSCVRYNPRDSKGQYLGSTERAAIFFAGRLNQFLPANPDWCGTANYQRFPEAEVLVP
jgi:hypothetical protein